jgi:hypothetical protein
MDEWLQLGSGALVMLLRAWPFSLVQVTEACSSEEPPKIEGREVGLGYKRGSAALEQDRSRDFVDIGGGQHDPGARADCGKRRGHRVAVAPRQIDVKQHPVRTRAYDGSERVLPVRCRIDDLQASQHEQLTHVSPEVLVVVDNQNPNRHPHSLVRASFAFHGGNPTAVALWSRCLARSRAGTGQGVLTVSPVIEPETFHA